MTNLSDLTDLTELIEYSDYHRKAINKLKSMGCDTTIIQNPDMSAEVLDRLSDMVLYNIPVNSKYYQQPEKFNKLVLNSYLRNGYCSLDNNPNLNDNVNYTNIPAEEIAMLDYLGLDSPSDLVNYDMEQTLETRLGKEYNISNYTQGIEDYIDYHNHHNDRKYVNQYCYTVAVGKQHWLRPKRYLRNEIISYLVYNEAPGLDEIIRHAEIIIQNNKYNAEGDFFVAVQREFNLTGRVSIMLDKNYMLDEQIAILDVYKRTGIDLRVVEDSRNMIKLFKKELDSIGIYTTLFYEFCTETFSSGEMKLYRQMSNQFREDRLHQKGLEQSR